MPTNKKRIQAYVNDATWAALQAYALSEGISISEAATRLLQTHLSSGSHAVSSALVDQSDFVTREQLQSLLADVHRRIQDSVLASVQSLLDVQLIGMSFLAAQSTGRSPDQLLQFAQSFVDQQLSDKISSDKVSLDEPGLGVTSKSGFGAKSKLSAGRSGRRRRP